MNTFKSVIDTAQLDKTNTISKNSIITYADHSGAAIPSRNEFKLDSAKIAQAQADAQWIMGKFGK